jgi:hypothetical protein
MLLLHDDFLIYAVTHFRFCMAAGLHDDDDDVMHADSDLKSQSADGHLHLSLSRLHSIWAHFNKFTFSLSPPTHTFFACQMLPLNSNRFFCIFNFRRWEIMLVAPIHG